MRGTRVGRCAAALLAALAMTALCVGCESQSAANGVRTGVAASTPSTSASAAATPEAARTPAAVPTYTYEVVNSWPHDPKAFTQGLVFHDGHLLESTGQYGESTLRRVELKTGKVLKKVSMAPEYFGEGLALFDGKLFQLTWTTRKGFIYDASSLKQQGEFRYDGEGWGLTQDGKSLILSDGTSQLRFINPSTFKLERTLNVTDGGRPVRELNELEFVKGEIFANIWHSNRIARIDPRTGNVLGWIDLSGLLPPSAVGNDPEAVLNGIAYDAAGDRLFVTGKLWPKLFEIKLRQK